MNYFRHNRQLGALAAATILLGSLGCGHDAAVTSGRSPQVQSIAAGSANQTPSAPSSAAAPAVPQVGNLTVELRWPAVRPLATKVIPESSSAATITVSALDMSTPLYTSVSRAAGQTSVTATLTVPTGTNRSITVVATNGGTTTANGSAAGITVGSAPNASVPVSMVATTVPAITSLSQANGGPSATVTLTGTNFVPPGTSAPAPASANTSIWNLKFAGTGATVSAWSNTSITCTVPAGAVTGNITVTADAVPSASTANFKVLQSLALTPAGPGVAIGNTQTFTATGTDTANQSVSNPAVTWSSSNTTVGTISSAGVFSGLATGSSTVTAASGTVTGTAQALVSQNGLIDGNTSIVLHGDGSDGGTSFPDSSLANPKTLTKQGGVTTSTTQTKFGSASISLDGVSGSYLTGGTSADYAFGSGDFTVDFWVYPTSFTSSDMCLYDTLTYGGAGSRNNAVVLIIKGGTSGKLAFFSNTGYSSSSNQALTVNSWNHVAFVRTGTTAYFFVNGTKDSVQPTLNTNLSTQGSIIGVSADSGGGAFPGYIDELRISKGVARWTANFTPPTGAY